MSEQKKEPLIELNIGRKIFQEILAGAGAFGFLMIFGNLFQSLGINPSEKLASAIGKSVSVDGVQQTVTGFSTPLNAVLGNIMLDIATDQDLNLKILMAHKLNMKLKQAIVFVDKHKRLLIDIQDDRYKSIDPELFIKKTDIDLPLEDVRKLLNYETWGQWTFRIVVQRGVPIGLSLIVGGGLAGLTSFIPLKVIPNEFARQVVAACTGQVSARLTQVIGQTLFRSKLKEKNADESEESLLLPRYREDSTIFDHESLYDNSDDNLNPNDIELTTFCTNTK